ncbi:hypothetical protein BKA62DRAFT_697110 [Auriculariales sp. MPI-PUGE-AT-0066]|nr:hypothetical protein BKA62DRAFT_697110 [Auriculariales sp. MPI-PUGE-AT-0066]
MYDTPDAGQANSIEVKDDECPGRARRAQSEQRMEVEVERAPDDDDDDDDDNGSDSDYQPVCKKSRAATKNSSASTPTFPSQNDTYSVQVTGELKNKGEDAFSDTCETFVLTTNSARHTLGQMGQMFYNVMSKQNRTHLFSLFILSTGWARIIRWDRAVVLVSASFNFTESQPSVLGEFFHRISRVPRNVLGHDTTVRPATEIEARQAAPHLDDFKTNHQIYEETPRFQAAEEIVDLDEYIAIEVPDRSSHRVVIARKLTRVVEDPMSRATRGYAVYDLADKRMAYLKDSWPAASHVTHEHEVLQKLNGKKVPYIPTFICGGPVLGQHSSGPTIAEGHDVSCDWNKGCVKFEQRVHQRFLVREIGKPLAFRLEAPPTSQSRNIVQRIIEAITAHQAALFDAETLHRDISEGNVLHVKLCDKDGDISIRALLIDWDMSKDANLVATRKERTGTWLFLSLNLLSEFPRSQTFSDDLESFVWLLVYLFLRHIPWKRRTQVSDPANVAAIIRNVFEAETYSPSLRRMVGGSGKMILMWNANSCCLPEIVEQRLAYKTFWQNLIGLTRCLSITIRPRALTAKHRSKVPVSMNRSQLDWPEIQYAQSSRQSLKPELSKSSSNHDLQQDEEPTTESSNRPKRKHESQQETAASKSKDSAKTKRLRLSSPHDRG